MMKENVKTLFNNANIVCSVVDDNKSLEQIQCHQHDNNNSIDCVAMGADCVMMVGRLLINELGH